MNDQLNYHLSSDPAATKIDAPGSMSLDFGLEFLPDWLKDHPQRGHVPITIHLSRGRYELGKSWRFGPEHSGTSSAPVTICGDPDGQTQLCGGRQLSLRWEPYDGNIVRARVELEAMDQFFVNGALQLMARYPSYDSSAQYLNGTSRKCFSPERQQRWAHPEGGYLHALHRSLWGDMHWRMLGKNEHGEVELEGGWQNNRQMGPHEAYRYVENIFEELTDPGEWYFDASEKWLYYYPPVGVDLQRSRFETVDLVHVIEMLGSPTAAVEHVHLKGLHIRLAARTFMENREPLLRSDWTTYRGGAVTFKWARHCSLTDSYIDHVGGNGIFVDDHTIEITIAGCRIDRPGASGVSIVGHPSSVRSPLFEYHQEQALSDMDLNPGPQAERYPRNIKVEDCLITGNGVVEKQSAGINIAMARGVQIRHCTIYDCPRAGINICDGCFGGHLIEGNDVFDTVKETGDHGSFNGWGRDRFWHKKPSVTEAWVAQCPEIVKLDCVEPVVIRNNRWRCDYGWDIDLDDGCSHYEIYNNLCLAGGIKLREGYHRRAWNNILVNSSFSMHVWYRESDTHVHDNIVMDDAVVVGCEEESLETLDLSRRNLLWKPTPGSDVRFVDPETGDYRVLDTVPLGSVRFLNFSMHEFGVRLPTLKALASSPILPDSEEGREMRRRQENGRVKEKITESWMGASVRNILDENDLSALGLAELRGVFITWMRAPTPLKQIGLEEGDVILAIGGIPVEDLQSLKALISGEGDLPGIGEVSVWRDQELIRVGPATIENSDGTPMKIATDYFGKPRDPENPSAGPFAGLKPGKHEIKVWPK